MFGGRIRLASADFSGPVAEATGDERVVPLFRRFAELRERLVDYLAEQAEVAVRTDQPLMRPLFFGHAPDPAVWAGGRLVTRDVPLEVVPVYCRADLWPVRA